MIIRLRQRRGVVLLLGLLLMAAIVASTIAIATSISDSTRQSKNLDDFVIASLAADSGLERGLAAVKSGRTSVNIASAVRVAGKPPVAMSLSSSAATVTVDSTTPSQALSIPVLRPNDSVSFDIFNFDQNTGTLQPVAGGANSTITVTGSAQTPGKLEITWIGLDNNAQPIYSGRFPIPTVNLNGTSNPVDLSNTAYIRTDTSDSTIGGSVSGIKGFRVTARAIDVLPHDSGLTETENSNLRTIRNITISLPTPASGTTPGLISLTSTGAVSTSQSIKQTSVLWQLPASPLFNFVLFTEGDICPNDPSCSN